MHSKKLHTTSPSSISNLEKTWGPETINAPIALEFEVERGGQQICSNFTSMPVELQPKTVMFKR